MTTAQDQARTLLQQGRESEAVAIVEREASAGHAWAMFAFAECKLVGQGTPRDPEGAVNLLERAGGLGWQAAAMRLVSLYASGTGCPEQPDRARAIIDVCKQNDSYAAAQAKVLETEQEKPEYETEKLHEALGLRILREVLTPLECQWIQRLAEPFLEPSFVEDPESGKRVPHPVRRSSGMSFGPLQEDLVVNRINRRIARLTGTPYSCGEPLHVLSYETGEEYLPHVDPLPGAFNQRRLTAIVYLNDDYEGGGTEFPELALKVVGKKGDLLLFDSLTEAGDVDRRSKHAGLPVGSGRKWIATRWIRQQPYHPWRDANEAG